VLDEPIGYAYVQQRQLQPRGGEQFTDARSRSAYDGVLLDGDDGAMALGKRQHQLFIERFHEPHVDEGRIQALGNFLRRLDQGPESEYRKATATVAAQLRLSHGISAMIAAPGPVPRG